jgi:hypothetical protein
MGKAKSRHFSKATQMADGTGKTFHFISHREGKWEPGRRHLVSGRMAGVKKAEDKGWAVAQR